MGDARAAARVCPGLATPMGTIGIMGIEGTVGTLGTV